MLTGLAGDDTYFVDAGDVVVEAANGGNDRVVIDLVRGGASIQRGSGKKFYLDDYANVENIAANGNVRWVGTGYALDGLHLVGNRQDNSVSGSLANDTLEGGAGNDVLEDRYHALYPSGAGRVIDTDELYGGEGNDRLISYEGADLLDGGAGNDTLISNGYDSVATLRGGAGNDTYEIRAASHIVSEDANGGIDTVRFNGSGNYVLAGNVENLEFLSSGRGTGNAGNNTVSTAYSDNVLDGGDGTYRYRSGDGNDTVSEAGGDDTVELLDLNPGDVRIVQGLNGNPDHIVDALTGYTITLDLNMVSPGWSADGSQVEHLRFADGTVWNSDQMRAAAELERSVSLMVQAMATFSVPAPGLVTSTPLDDPSRLAPVLAANWG